MNILDKTDPVITAWHCMLQSTCVFDVSMGGLTMKQRQNSRHFADDIFKFKTLCESCILIQISLTFVPNDPFNNQLALFGTKLVSEPMID